MSGEKKYTFRERLTQLIESSAKSQTSIASDFGISKQTLSAWLTGQNSPRTPTISALASYFDVSIAWLMGFDVPMRESEPEMMDSDEKDPGLSQSEEYLVDSYRSLNPHGKELLLERASELRVLYGEKNPDASSSAI